MWCRTCGKQLMAQAVVCVGCGCPPLVGNRFCCGCGNETQPAAVMCVKCGCALHSTSDTGSTPPPLPGQRDPNMVYPAKPAHSPIVMALLSFLLAGGLGQIVMGQVGKGLLIMLLTICTCGVFGIIGIIDAYMIARKLEAGTPVRKWEWF